MNTPYFSLAGKVKAFSIIMSALTVLLGLAVLAGWAADSTILKSLSPNYVSMKVNTALSFVLCGLSILLLHHASAPGRKIAVALALLVLMIGLLTLCQDIFHLDFHLDQLLFKGTPDNMIGTSARGRMSPQTAVCFQLISLSLLLLNSRIDKRLPQGLLFAVFFIAFLTFLGYAYRAPALYGFRGTTQMALHTSMVLILLSLGALSLKPNEGWVGIIAAATPGGKMARRVMIASFLVPFLIAWVGLKGYWEGWYGTEFGVAVFLMLIILFFEMIVWRNAVSIHTSYLEQQAAEEKLSKNRLLVEAILDNTTSVIFIKDLAGKYLLINKQYEKLFHISREAIAGKSDYDIFPKEMADAFHAADLQVAKERQVKEIEEVAPHDDGLHRYISVKFPLYDKNGKVYAVGGIATDITALKKAEDELRKSRAFLDSIVEHIPNMIFVKDAADLRFRRFNRAGEELLGFPREELIGKNDYDFFPKEEADFFTQKDREVLSGRKMVDIPEEPILTRFKGERILHTKKIPLYDSSGNPEYLLGISEDITEAKRAQEALKKAHDELEARVKERTAELMMLNETLRKRNEDLDNFVYSASHDLKTPILNLDLLMKVLYKKAHLDKSMKLITDKIDLSIQVIEERLEKLAQIAKVQKNLFDDIADISFDELLKEIVSETEEIIKSSGAKIKSDFRNASVLHYSRTALKSILYNFVTNAIKYRAPQRQPEVFIKTGKKDGYVVLSVRDNGLGIDLKKDREKLFAIFKRLHDHVEGAGIGLYMVKRMIENNGGKIEVESEVGKGTAFHAYFRIK
ncbi:MAG TPA: PAS domain-containing sensor histidine kinase [Chitinophagales bacterium]|nr:PAS domain-containing sensor histidine kinase [Chitinophagales bacterium]